MAETVAQIEGLTRREKQRWRRTKTARYEMPFLDSTEQLSTQPSQPALLPK